MRKTCLGILAAGLLPFAAAAVTIDLVPVGDLGNAPDPLNTNSVPGIGTVDYGYSIGTYEVLNSQYVEFLNAVAAVGDTYGLWNGNMGSSARGGISRAGLGTVGNPYVYSSKANMGDKPVNYVTFYNAVRFVNWLENGQPVGAQGAGTTETGSYTLFTSGTTTTNVSARGASATWVMPTESEWYKAAYHDPTAGATTNYWLYPVQSDGVPTLALADATGNITNDGPNVVNYAAGADWNAQNGNVTTVGSAGASSDSFYGTFDQGGNVWEWTETIDGLSRIVRGGSYDEAQTALRSTARLDSLGSASFQVDLGFRVAAIPEPANLGVVLIAVVAACVRRGKTRGPMA